MSRSASAAPRSPATVEKRAKSSVFLPTWANHGGTGVAGDVVRDSKRAVGAGTLGVHASFRDDLTVEMGQFFQKPDVLQQHGAARAGCEHPVVVRYGAPALVVSLGSCGMARLLGLKDYSKGRRLVRPHLSTLWHGQIFL